ncbi:MAG: hypothetical protein NTV49_09050 [Kiritimatiellaeota bacterium]|nr:hypothetical protein [Kiritimatiellota bacterium]
MAARDYLAKARRAARLGTVAGTLFIVQGADRGEPEMAKRMRSKQLVTSILYRKHAIISSGRSQAINMRNSGGVPLR